jgi:uncharacterized phage protein (TIGR01671 family)
MRQFKFRVWDPFAKEMIYFPNRYKYLVFTDSGAECLSIDKETEVSSVNLVLEIMECTGLTDKDNKEIYEGDILCYKSIAYGSKFGTAYWNNYICGFSVNMPDEFGIDIHFMEIVGNKYENPLLLEILSQELDKED